MSLGVVVLGPPGAGKGTQGESLARAFGIPKISTGDMLRDAVAARTALGRAVAATVHGGGLVSDETMIAIVRERLARPDASCGFVLDGFPRTVAQAEALDETMAGRGPLTVLYLDVPTEELVRRLTTRRICGTCGTNAPPGARDDDRCGKCGGGFERRRDDDEAIVRERLRTYHEQTAPLVAFYRASATFHAIAGNRPPEVVAAALGAAFEADAVAAGRLVQRTR